MNHIRRSSSILATLVASALVLISVPALAQPIPPNDHPLVSRHPVLAHVTVAGGMPGWEITLIAAGAAMLGAALAVFLDRARRVHRHPSPRAV